MSEPDDKKVKELLAASTRAELERWFGLPSFEQLSERGVEPRPPEEDPEFAVIRKRREDAEVRNQAESLVYQTEKFVKENDEKLPADVKDSVNASLGEAQEALKGTDTAEIKSAMEKLATESQKLGAALYQQQGGDAGAAGANPGAGQSQAGADDVVDAEIVDEDEK